MPRDLTDLMTAMLGTIKGLSDRLSARIEALEQRRAAVDGRDGADGAPGADGKDGADGVAGKDGAQGRDGTDGRDGKDADPQVIRDEIAKAIAALPRAVDGAPGRDGIGLAGAVIDRHGQLILTLSDGTPVMLGTVVGRDGQKGDPGQDGRDGLGVDDFDLDVRSDGVYGVWTRGEQHREKLLPVPVYVGIWTEGKTYQPGQSVTWDRSTWIAKTATDAKPGLNTDASRAWQMSVRKGTDGKPGKDGAPGERGPKGETGDRGPERW